MGCLVLPCTNEQMRKWEMSKPGQGTRSTNDQRPRRAQVEWDFRSLGLQGVVCHDPQKLNPFLGLCKWAHPSRSGRLDWRMQAMDPLQAIPSTPVCERIGASGRLGAGQPWAYANLRRPGPIGVLFCRFACLFFDNWLDQNKKIEGPGP